MTTFTTPRAVAAFALCAGILLGGCSPSDAPPAPEMTTAAPGGVTSTPANSEPVESEPAEEAPVDAKGLAELIEQPTTTKIVTITEDNDPNDLIGRPNGYVSAAILQDKGGECDELGADCGASIEVFATQAEAGARSEYILAILKEAPMLGTEWHTLNGAALLRVTGHLKPSVAEGYAAAFK